MAVPLFKEGKVKDVIAQYPWFTTQGEPFTKLNKLCLRPGSDWSPREDTQLKASKSR